MQIDSLQTQATASDVDLVSLGMFPDFTPPVGSSLVHRETGAPVRVDGHGRGRIYVTFEASGGRAGVRSADLLMPRQMAASAPMPAPLRQPAARPAPVISTAPAAPVSPMLAHVAQPLPTTTQPRQQLAPLSASSEAKGGNKPKRDPRADPPHWRGAPARRAEEKYQENRRAHDSARADAVRQAHQLAAAIQTERQKSFRALGRDLLPGEALARAQRALESA